MFHSAEHLTRSTTSPAQGAPRLWQMQRLQHGRKHHKAPASQWHRSRPQPPAVVAIEPDGHPVGSEVEGAWAAWRASSSRAQAAAMLRKALAKFQSPAPKDTLPAYDVVEAASVLASTTDGQMSGICEESEGVEGLLSGTTTTFMVRNLPPQCKMSDLLQDWPIDGSYDFLYLPLSTGGRYALGYAFINFVTVEHAKAFAAQWNSQRLSHFEAGRRLRLSSAEHQGLEANVAKVRAKPQSFLRSRCCSPVIIRDGRVLGLRDI
mmetsp:Transcript_93764/g.262305  ORF Transcript_93764/g.262305 Transcript_93764/m.262305 type:complete len:263 (+) Transcript_93764:74-862(+)